MSTSTLYKNTKLKSYSIWLLTISLGFLSGCGMNENWSKPHKPKIAKTGSPAAETPQSVQSNFGFKRVRFQKLSGWDNEDFKGAMTAFRHSCKYFEKQPTHWDRIGLAEKLLDWNNACMEAKNVQDFDARWFFESYFSPYQVGLAIPIKGKLTSYAIPLIDVHEPPCRQYEAPFYGKPPLRLRKITRSEITNGALLGREMVCVNDQVDAYEAQIQGTSFVRFPSGKILRLGPVATNGIDYKSLYDYKVTIKSLRLLNPVFPEAVKKIMTLNPRYVFYSKGESDLTIYGSINVPLTPQRSLAVDPRFIPYGVPVWVGGVQRLVMAQDTGNAIKGAARGDFFMGTGDEAIAKARAINIPTVFFILLPNKVAANIQNQAQPVHRPEPVQSEIIPQPATTLEKPKTTIEGGHFIQLGIFSSEARAARFIQNYDTSSVELMGLPIQIQKDNATQFRVVVSGFNTESAARTKCKNLKQQGTDCIYKNF